MDKHTYCVIMAGGIGSRFWPKSRQSKPKQFLDILGTGKSFIRMTYERFEKLARPPATWPVRAGSIQRESASTAGRTEVSWP